MAQTTTLTENLPCPFCGKQHTVIQIKQQIGWNFDHDPLYSDWEPAVDMDCIHPSAHIPMRKWNLRHDTNQSLRGQLMYVTKILQLILAIACGSPRKFQDVPVRVMEINETEIDGWAAAISHSQEYLDNGTH